MQLDPEFEKRWAENAVKEIDDLNNAYKVIGTMFDMIVYETKLKRASIVFRVSLRSGLPEDVVREILKKCKK